jgi:GNAT superfamily N-acetyltransferase
MTADVHPATADRWHDIEAVFGRRGNDPSWCWCQRFLRSSAEAESDADTEPDNRKALRRQVSGSAVSPGLIAYVDGEPAGWTRVGPRTEFALIAANRALAKVLVDDPGAWWVTCFAIHNRHRREGVGAALLLAAVGFARQHGASSVEGHPVDTDALRAEKVGGSALFTGTFAMFVRAGFTEVGRTYPSRPVMRLKIN